MRLKILASGSKGNCAILKDAFGNQLILDCGVKYERLVVEIDWEQPCICLISHKHSDHYNEQTIEKIKSFGVEVYTEEKFSSGKPFMTNGFNVLPIGLPHGDCTSYSFLIFDSFEAKSIYFATDCTELPTIADKKINLIMVENNYDVDTVMENKMRGGTLNNGYLRHLSTEYVLSWLGKRTKKADNIIITHLSNSGNITTKHLIEQYKPYASNVYIAKEKLQVTF